MSSLDLGATGEGKAEVRGGYERSRWGLWSKAGGMCAMQHSRLNKTPRAPHPHEFLSKDCTNGMRLSTGKGQKLLGLLGIWSGLHL